MKTQKTKLSIGLNIKRALQKSGKKQKELGKFCGVDEPHVSKWCNGYIRPGSGNMQKIAEFTGYSVEEIMSGQFNEEKKVLRRYTPTNSELSDFQKTEVESIIKLVELLLLDGTGMSREELERNYGSKLNMVKSKIEMLTSISN